MKKYITITVACITLVCTGCTKTDSDVDVLTPEEQLLQKDFEYKQTIPTGEDLVDEGRGKELWLAIGAIQGVAGTPANGVAQSHFFENGDYQHGIQLNIEQAKDGYFYEGWLVDPKTDEFRSSGKITPLFTDVRHALQFEANEDLRRYSKIVVTLEPDDNDPAPAAHVAEANLQQVER